VHCGATARPRCQSHRCRRCCCVLRRRKARLTLCVYPSRPYRRRPIVRAAMYSGEELGSFVRVDAGRARHRAAPLYASVTEVAVRPPSEGLPRRAPPLVPSSSSSSLASSTSTASAAALRRAEEVARLLPSHASVARVYELVVAAAGERIVLMSELCVGGTLRDVLCPVRARLETTTTTTMTTTTTTTTTEEKMETAKDGEYR
jgi:hypothetical protein